MPKPSSPDDLSSATNHKKETHPAALTRPEGDSLDTPPARMQPDLTESLNRAAQVASIPNEILSAIFEAGCRLPQPQPQPSDSSSEVDEWEPPFEILVSQVTRHWRNVALATPSLWTQIYISDHDCLGIVAAYLTRSGCLPLDVEVEMRRPPRHHNGDPKLPSTRSIIATIAPHVGRCRRLCIHCDRPQRHLSALLRCLHSTTCPFLEFIQVSFSAISNDYDDGDEDYWQEEEEDDERDRSENIREILAGGAPSLKTIRLKGINLPFCLPPLASVTTLHMHCNSFMTITLQSCAAICSIFASCPVLTHLVLHGWFIKYSTIRSASTVAFPLLSSLRILSTKSHASLLEFLSLVSAPLLECLSFGQVAVESVEEVLKTQEWIATSPRYPRLHYLSVMPMLNAWHPFTPSTWKLIEQSFNTVTHLTVLDDRIASFSESLCRVHSTDSTWSPSTDVSWPNLKTLSLGGIQFPNDVEPFVEALSARVVMGRPLRKLRIPKQPGVRDGDFRDAFVRFQRYTEVEEYKPKRWPRGDFNDWYDGD